MIVERGIIKTYDATNHKAAVQLFGSMSRILLAVPVARHLTAPHLPAGAACAVAFFAEGSQALVFATFDALPEPILDLNHYGPTLDLRTLTRGSWDDFLGDAYLPQYTQDPDAGSTVGIWGSVGGGWARLANNAVLWNRARLWLGNSADGYATLDIQGGWMQIARMRLSTVADISATFGVSNAAETNFIGAGTNNAGGPNWEILLRTVASGWVHVQSAVAAATGTKDHALVATPVGGNYILDYYVSAVKVLSISSASYDIPTGVLTPLLRCQNRAAAARTTWYDSWYVVPETPAT